MPTEDKADQPATRDDLDRIVEQFSARLDGVAEQFSARLERAIEFMAGEFSRLHGEIKTRDDNNGRRLDCMSETLHTMDARLSAMTKWSDTSTATMQL